MDFQGQSERKRVCAPEQTLRYERSAYDCTRKVGADAPSRVAHLLLSTSMVGKLKRDLMRFVKLSSRKLCLVFDESDET